MTFRKPFLHSVATKQFNAPMEGESSTGDELNTKKRNDPKSRLAISNLFLPFNKCFFPKRFIFWVLMMSFGVCVCVV